MMDILANWVGGNLTTGITNVATTMNLTAANRNALPTIYPFRVVIWDSTTSSTPNGDPNREIVLVTGAGTSPDSGVTYDVPITRAYEGTAAVAHNTGGHTISYLQAVTAAMLNTDLYQIPSVLGVPIARGRFVRVQGVGLNIGANQDLGTVPAGKCWIVLTETIENTSAGSITFTPLVNVGGTYYPGGAAVTLASAANTSVAFGFNHMLTAGDKLAITTTTTNGLNVSLAILEFEAAANPHIVLARLTTTMNTTPVTLYTCPAGKTAVLLPLTFSLGGGSGGFIRVVADSGSSRSYNCYLVPSGQTAGPTYRVGHKNSVAAGTGDAVSIAGALGAGDFLAVDTSNAAAGQMAWAVLMEVPA